MTQAKHPESDSFDLRYLLTAYLFDSLSAEGRREVEAQLEKSAACRAELEELRSTLDLVEDALTAADTGGAETSPDSGTRYSFEERRLERVLEASRRSTARRARPDREEPARSVRRDLHGVLPGLWQVRRGAVG